ncbi:MAG: hypothetical protein COB98_03045 [Flavobacteriaceae bacterium]|nr:MAG: hypothetical protein COB98_03045 [Flavobacteriaceae bacterium]
MKKIIILSLFIITVITINSCGIYSFTGGDTGNAKTIQIDYFPNTATLVEPGLSQKFTQDLQDLFLTQTNLNLVKANGDLQFEGEITGYRINPMTATAQQTAAQNRLTITINCRYYNREEENKNFEKSFSFYHDYPADAQLTGGILDDAFEEILERITQDIFNASVANW